jgi:hypothetical protein
MVGYCGLGHVAVSSSLVFAGLDTFGAVHSDSCGQHKIYTWGICATRITATPRIPCQEAIIVIELVDMSPSQATDGGDGSMWHEACLAAQWLGSRVLCVCMCAQVHSSCVVPRLHVLSAAVGELVALRNQLAAAQVGVL